MPKIRIESGSLVLEGHLVRTESARALAILLHGIPGGPPPPDDPGYAGLAQTFAARGYSALHFDFRGVRGSPGDFSFAGWIEDLESAVDAVAGQRLPVIVVGSSAGGAVAIAAAARRKEILAVATLAAPASLHALIGDTETALARFRNLGIIHDPAFPTDTSGWANEFLELAPERVAASLAPRPLLIVHGDRDEVVPYAHAEALFAAASEPKELILLPQGGHQLRKDPRAVDAVLDWVDHLELPLA